MRLRLCFNMGLLVSLFKNLNFNVKLSSCYEACGQSAYYRMLETTSGFYTILTLKH